MSKIYTLFYILNNFETEENELIDYKLDFVKSLNAFQLFTKCEEEPSNKVIDNILLFSKTFK